MAVARRPLVKRLLIHLGLLPFLIFALFPFYHMTLTSLKQDRELYDSNAVPLVIRQGPTLEHYRMLIWETAFLVWTKNSLIITVLSTAVSLVNTFLAMAIDVETRRPKLSNVLGGLSGPAIRPIAIRMVWECFQQIRIPIIGMGGITNAADAIEFMLAGSTAVQIGTANFSNPFVWTKVLDGLDDYMRRHEIARVTELIGQVDTTPRREVHA